MRTTAGSAASTARTVGSATLPPGLPLALLAYVVAEVAIVPIIKRHTSPIKRHTSPITSIIWENQPGRFEHVPVDTDLYIINVLPLITEEKPSLKSNTIISYTNE